jgi:hypothetical protein
MIEVAQRWLDDQQSQQRELLLVVDRLAEPDPIKGLFGADLMQDYVNLYQGSEFADLADVGPWLVRLTDAGAAFLYSLLETPNQHWGWLASAEHIDLSALAQHWRERMVIEENGQRALYRFQDNRVIARHLGELTEPQLPLLLGPLNSALYWDEQAWIGIDNPRPGNYPPPFETPWLDIPETAAIANEIRRHNLEQWLWQNHSTATACMAELQPLDSWLDEQLAKAQSWQWQSLESIQFLLEHQLDPGFADHPSWAALEGETPDAHLARSRCNVPTTAERHAL